MTAAGPEDTAAGRAREANRETARVPGRRSTFRPSSETTPAAFLTAIAAASARTFPDAPLVRVVEQTRDGQRVSEGFLVRRDGGDVQVASRGEHWLVPTSATIHDVATGDQIAGPGQVIPQRLRDHLIDFFREELGWDWPAEDPDEPAPIFGCDTRIPSSQEALEDLVDELAPLLAAERKRVAQEVVAAVMGKATIVRNEDEVEFYSIDPNDVALYAAERGLQ